jgi:CRISPR-associated protein Cst1
MDEERIKRVRELGDHLAEYTISQDDRYFFTNFRVQNYHVFRTLLLRANLAQLKRGQTPIIDFDSYIEVFELAENDSHPDWRLARDLVFIRMIEQLHKRDWLGRNADALPEVAEEESDAVQS